MHKMSKFVHMKGKVKVEKIESEMGTAGSGKMVKEIFHFGWAVKRRNPINTPRYRLSAADDNLKYNNSY